MGRARYSSNIYISTTYNTLTSIHKYTQSFIAAATDAAFIYYVYVKHLSVSARTFNELSQKELLQLALIIINIKQSIKMVTFTAMYNTDIFCQTRLPLSVLFTLYLVLCTCDCARSLAYILKA